MWQLASGVYLGWALGSNDASNVFGTAVAARMLRFWTAAILCSVFVVLGSYFGGAAGMHTYQELTRSGTNLNTAFLVGLASALTVTVMTWKRLPVSTSQAVVGALIAVGVWQGRVELGVLGKVVACWIGTPIGAMLIVILLYVILASLMNQANLNFFEFDSSVRYGLVISGCYGAYALGANNVANVTGAFVGEGMLTVEQACLVGGLSIALGIITFSRGVMLTVGQGLVKLDAFCAFLVVLSEAITVHLYAMVGVPVSTSQAVVGGVIGVGLIKGGRTVNRRVLRNILLAWISTPVVAFVVTLLFCWVAKVAGLI